MHKEIHKIEWKIFTFLSGSVTDIVSRTILSMNFFLNNCTNSLLYKQLLFTNILILLIVFVTFGGMANVFLTIKIKYY